MYSGPCFRILEEVSFMKLKDILIKQIITDEDKRLIDSWVRKIPHVAQNVAVDEEVSIHLLDKILWAQQRKYGYQVQYVMVSSVKDIEASKRIPVYTASVKNKNQEWLGPVYGTTIYETFQKLALFMYAKSREEQ
jgi:hypothetical protein